MANLNIPTPSGPESDARRRFDEPIHSSRHVRIICIGAGASGLLLAYKLQRNFNSYGLQIYEKNREVSGTWTENRYPGVACDVPSHSYTWSFEPKPDWSGVYPPGEEIFHYFDDFATKYGLHRFVKRRHLVTGCWWDNAKGIWNVKIKDMETGQEISDHCNILINAGGILNRWKWPTIPGLEKYQGKLLHTANWDDNVDLKGRNVGLVGNGSSGIQVLPTIQPYVRHVTVFIRNPSWVSPAQGLENHLYSEQERHEFATNPEHLLSYRKRVESGLNGQFSLFIRGTSAAQETQAYIKDQMESKLNSASHQRHLIPDWNLGCRRLTAGVGFLEALGEDNVTTVYGDITHLTERGCVCSDGKEYPTDMLICATGFDTSFKPQFPIVGLDGCDLRDLWADEPQSYLGVAAAGMPNYLMFLGPNCPIGNGPVLSGIGATSNIETQADYMLKLIDRYQTHNIHSITPSAAAIADFVSHKNAFMQRTVWIAPCRSWYKLDGTGTVTALWPGSTLHSIEALMEVRWEDWDMRYVGNRFAWLGNGYSQIELDQSADWSYYIRNEDDDAPLSRNRLKKVISKSGTVTEVEVVNFAARRE